MDDLILSSGRLLPDSSPSRITEAPEVCLVWPVIPLHNHLFRFVDSALGVLEDYSSGICDSSLVGHRQVLRGLPSGVGHNYRPMQELEHPNHLQEVGTRTETNGDLSLDGSQQFS